VWIVALATTAVAVLALGWRYRWVTDDGFIYFRIARQVLEGNGPVFNDGQRVETFTSPLWLAILVLGDLLLPLPLEWVAVGLGLLCTVAGVVLAMLGARALWGPAEERLFLPFAVLAVVALVPFWIFATSGLETGLVFLWLGLSLLLLARWAHGARLGVPQLVVLGLGWLVRPELVVVSALILVLLLAGRGRGSGTRSRLALVASMVALPVAYQVFRMGYFGAITANTAIAKEGSEIRWDRGWRYLLDLVQPYWLWVAAVAVVVGGYLPLVALQRRRRRVLGVVAVFLGGGLVIGTYVVAVGGDYLHGRLLLPAVFAVLAPVAAVPVRPAHAGALLIVPWAIVCGLDLRPLEGPGTFTQRGFVVLLGRGAMVDVEDFGWTTSPEDAPWYTGPGVYMQQDVFAPRLQPLELPPPPGAPPTVAVLAAIGIPGYALGTDVEVVDVLGLADPLTSRLEGLEGDYSLPGHEKPLPLPWLVARLTGPDVRVPARLFPETRNPLLPSARGAAFQEQVAWARAAVQCPDLYHALRATTEPLRPRLFLSNLVRSPQYTRLRVPPDPEEAYREFCGSGTPPEVQELRDAPARLDQAAAGRG
jgi:arabinofuranosyltransferase